MKRPIASAFAALALLGAGAAPATARPVAEAATGTRAISVGLHRWVTLGTIRLRADRVIEDSRCPMNARCVWAGRAVVAVTLVERGKLRKAVVTLGEPVSVARGTLALVSVRPEKMAGQQPPPRPYRFTFELRD